MNKQQDHRISKRSWGRLGRWRIAVVLATAVCSCQAFSSNANSRRLRPSLGAATSTSHPTTTTEDSIAATAKELEQEILRLGRNRQTDQALRLLDHSTIPPTIRLVNAALDACSRARPPRLETAFDYLDQFQSNDNGGRFSHLSPNVFTFGVLMNACARAGQATRAIQLLKQMESQWKVTPNAVVVSAAISACAKATPPQPQQALQLVDKYQHTLNVIGCNAALSACAQAGDEKAALQLLEQMKSGKILPPPDAVTYGTVLAACERAGDWKTLLSVAEDRTDLDGLALTSCLHACQQLGMAEKALDYLNQMKALETRDDDNERQHSRRNTRKRPSLTGPDAVAYKMAISACARGGAWIDGLRLLQEMKEHPTIQPDVVAYTAAITGCEYVGEWKRAFMLLEQMRKQGIAPNEWTMAAILGACATACGNMVKSANSGKTELTPSFPSKEKANSGKTELTPSFPPKEKALRLLHVLEKDPTVVSPNIQVYNAGIRVCAEAGDLDRAWKIFDGILQDRPDLEPTVFTYGALMTACERTGNVEGASKVFQVMRDNDMVGNEIIYGAAISCCRKAGGHADRVFRLVEKMLKLGLSPNIATWNTALMAQVEGKSKEDLQHALSIYRMIKKAGVQPNRLTYGTLIRALAGEKEPDLAEQFLRRMRADGFIPDVDLYTATVTGYERTGQPLKALRLMESMQEDGYDFYSVAVLNTAFKKAVNLANAVGRGLQAKNDQSSPNVGASGLDFPLDDGESVFCN